MKKIVTASFISLVLALFFVACTSSSDDNDKDGQGIWYGGHGAGGDATGWISSTATATGTYSYNPATSTLTFNVTAVELFCDGPEVGTESMVVIKLDATTLEIEGDLVFTRSPGDPNSMAGTWVHQNITWTLGPDGSLKIRIVGINCIKIKSGYDCADKNGRLSIFVKDLKHKAVKINAFGPGIAGSPDLLYDQSGFEKKWAFSNGFWPLALNTVPPLEYFVTIYDVNGENVFAVTINQFAPCPICLFPIDFLPSVTNPVEFKWNWAAQPVGLIDYSFYDLHVIYVDLQDPNSWIKTKHCEVDGLTQNTTTCSKVPESSKWITDPSLPTSVNYFYVTSNFSYGTSTQTCGPFTVK